MKWHPKIDDVLRDLSHRGIECGLATLPGGRIRTWIEVDGALIEGNDFEAANDVSDQVAQWLMETADSVYGALPDNVVDARARFMRGRGTRCPNEALTP